VRGVSGDWHPYRDPARPGASDAFVKGGGEAVQALLGVMCWKRALAAERMQVHPAQRDAVAVDGHLQGDHFLDLVEADPVHLFDLLSRLMRYLGNRKADRRLCQTPGL